jgi:hypothetical protein
MIGITLSIPILVIILFIACFINFYAIANFALSRKDDALNLGLAAVLSTVTTVVLIFIDTAIFHYDFFDALLFGGVTGILFASMKIRKKVLGNDIKASKRILQISAVNYIIYASVGMIIVLLLFLLID